MGAFRYMDVQSIEWAQERVGRWHRARWPNRTHMRREIVFKLMSEVGELADALCEPSSHTNVRDRGVAETEWADVLIALLALADEEGFDGAAAFQRKFGEVVVRRALEGSSVD